MAENSQGKKYGHEINFHGPYLDGQINLTFHVVSSSKDQITTIKEIADLIREEGTIPATGNYTYYEKQEEKNEVEKKEESEETKDEASVATPRPTMKTVEAIQVDGDGIKPIFAKEENSVEPKIMTMSLESVSTTDDTAIYPTILSAEAPAVLADTGDDSKLITYGNLKAFAELTDGRYVQIKDGDTAPGNYLTSSEVDEKIANGINSGLKSGDTILYMHSLHFNSDDLAWTYFVINKKSAGYRSAFEFLYEFGDHLSPETWHDALIYDNTSSEDPSYYTSFAMTFTGPTTITGAYFYVRDAKGGQTRLDCSSVTCTDTVTPVKAV